MPRSADEGKAWTRDRIVCLKPASILDIGPGAGTYADLLRPHLPTTHFTGIEIFGPYIERYGLRSKYDELLIRDVRDLDVLPVVDVVILGDVLEHMPHDDALTLWRKARAAARQAVVLSLPIYGYEQGECEGNIHETHRHQWSDVTVRTELVGITHWVTLSIVGVYVATGSGDASQASDRPAT